MVIVCTGNHHQGRIEEIFVELSSSVSYHSKLVTPLQGQRGARTANKITRVPAVPASRGRQVGVLRADPLRDSCAE